MLLAAQLDNKIVGFCLCYVHFRGWALFDSIAVERKFKRRGIATKLLKEAISRVGGIGVAYIQGLVCTNNKNMQMMIKAADSREGTASA